MTRVNIMVDDGIKPLVDALQTVPGLITVDSCQGESSGAGIVKAHVFFTAKDGTYDLFSLCQGLSESLSRQLNWDGGEWSITLTWFTSMTPMGNLEVIPDIAYIEKVAAAITSSKG